MGIYFSASTLGFYVDGTTSAVRPNDCVEITEEKHQEMLAGELLGKTIGHDSAGQPVLIDAPPLTQKQIVASYSYAIEKRLIDKLAQDWGYTSGERLAGYADSTHPPFKAEALAFIAYRDQVWVKCYQIIDDVKSGARLIPSVEQLIKELPAAPSRPS